MDVPALVSDLRQFLCFAMLAFATSHSATAIMKRISVITAGRHAKASCLCLLVLFELAGCSWREEKTTFYPNGQIKVRWHERMIGPYRTVKDGAYEAFYPTGARLTSGEFRNGDSVGLWEEWYLYGGKRFEKTFGATGRLQGQSIVWMPNGDTVELRTFNDRGELDGRQVVYWPETGEMRQQGEYKAGKRQGPWQAWYRNGRIEDEREYDQGRSVGTWIDYGLDGNIASKREFLKDLPGDLARRWSGALVEGVPAGRSLNFQRRDRRVDTIPAEERIYGELRKRGDAWIVPFRWLSPRFEAFYQPRNDTLVVWRPAASPARSQ
jgi:antitoxin component YwqK of YwqJK toxin-antitoxin module